MTELDPRLQKILDFIEPPQNRQSARMSGATKWFGVGLSALVLLFSQACYAAQKTIEWFDKAFDRQPCSRKITFDPKKYGEKRIRDTADFLILGYPGEFPFPQDYFKPGDAGVNGFKNACARHSRVIQSLDLIDLPGVETYRRLKLEQLEDWCDYGAALIRGTFGDTSALRSFKASAPSCSRYVDALERTDLRQAWRETITSYCRGLYNPKSCRDHFFAAERQPDEVERIKDDILAYGWQHCTVALIKTGNSVQQEASSIRHKVAVKFEAQFKMTPGCYE